jgi:hypothetical protein
VQDDLVQVRQSFLCRSNGLGGVNLKPREHLGRTLWAGGTPDTNLINIDPNSESEIGRGQTLEQTVVMRVTPTETVAIR